MPRPNFVPNYNTISSFFGAEKNADGTYSFNNKEKISDNGPIDWLHTPTSMSQQRSWPSISSILFYSAVQQETVGSTSFTLARSRMANWLLLKMHPLQIACCIILRCRAFLQVSLVSSLQQSAHCNLLRVNWILTSRILAVLTLSHDSWKTDIDQNDSVLNVLSCVLLTVWLLGASSTLVESSSLTKRW
jgi:hypothetical protein